MNHSDQIDQLAAALSLAQSEIEGAVKGATNPHFRTKYADLGAVWDAIREPFTRNGLSITQLPSCAATANALAIETVLMHKSGQWVSETFVMPVSKADPQGFGSALTYARRYSLMAVAGIAPVDDDGNEGSKAPPRVEPPKAEPKPEPRPEPKPVPKTEITSGPMTPQTRTKEQWARACEGWRDGIKNAHSVAALNDLQQQLTEAGELDALGAFNPSTYDFFMNAETGQFARRRAVLAAVENSRQGAMLRAG